MSGALTALTAKHYTSDPRLVKATFSLAASGVELRWSRTAYLLDTPLLNRLVQLARRGAITSL